MAYTDPRKNAKFVDDNHLRGRDNSGGAMNREMQHSTDFGEGAGKMRSGGPGDNAGMDDTDNDDVQARGAENTAGPMKPTRKAPQAGY